MNNNYPHFSYRFSGGTLNAQDPTYVVRSTDRDFYETLKQREFCYVLSARQMGKSSLRIRTMNRLKQENIACADVDLTGVVSTQTSPEQLYLGIIRELISCFQLQVNRREWWKEHSDLTFIHRFEVFIEEILLKKIKQDIIIFVDEIDSILRLSCSIDDFFELIRACYNRRASQPDYKRLTWSLLGAATPLDLIKIPLSAPLNIGRVIELRGFALEESFVLEPGLTNRAARPRVILQEILGWTGGQPFLTQKLCWLVSSSETFVQVGEEAKYIKQLVYQKIINNWESHDDPPHFKTIRNHLISHPNYAQKQLQLYRQILNRGKISDRNTPEYQALKLSGLVTRNGKNLTVCNPIYKSIFNLNWTKIQQSQLQEEQQNFPVKISILVSCVTTCLIVGLRLLGVFQNWELLAFDHLMRRQLQESPDERLLIIGVNEQDIKKYGYPLSDRVLVQLLEKLQQYQPIAIGLDIFRDQPVPDNNPQSNNPQSYEALALHFRQNKNLITICAFTENAAQSVPPPPSSAEEQVGFADLYLDSSFAKWNSVVRRHLLSRTSGPDNQRSACTTDYSFAWQLIYLYFVTQEVPVMTSSKTWNFGSVRVQRLKSRSGGYQNLDARGTQLLLNYRRVPNSQTIAQQVTVRDILDNRDRFDPEWIRDRVILIGMNATTVRDSHNTPFGTMPGLHIHAHAVSQILSAVEDNRLLLWWWPVWIDGLWIGLWSGVSGIIFWKFSAPSSRNLGSVAALVALYGCCWIILNKGGWIPLIPSGLALITTHSVLLLYLNGARKPAP